jgi:two-component system nitrate/nitrite response regulator NarL
LSSVFDCVYHVFVIRHLQKMKFLLVEDHAVFRYGLAKLLATLPGSHEFLESETCETAFTDLAQHKDIDLILLDLALPGLNGLDGLVRFRKLCPTTPIVLLSANENPQFVVNGMRRGAQGFIPKSASPDVLIHAIQLVLAGGTYVPAATILPNTRPSNEKVTLTARQREVLNLLSRNLSNKEIAEALGMRVNTVRVHLAAIFKTLGVENRVDAARAALNLEPANE